MLKKIFIVVILAMLVLNGAMAASVRNIQDNYRFTYTLIDENGDPVTGQTVALRIQKVSNGQWYDFNDNTFKASGWTSPTVNLSYDATGAYYFYLYDPPASETAAEQYILVIDNASVDYGDHQNEVVCYQDIGISTLTASNVWDESLTGHTTAGTAGKNLNDIETYTNGVKDGGVFNGIENLIRSQR